MYLKFYVCDSFENIPDDPSSLVLIPKKFFSENGFFNDLLKRKRKLIKKCINLSRRDGSDGYEFRLSK